MTICQPKIVAQSFLENSFFFPDRGEYPESENERVAQAIGREMRPFFPSPHSIPEVGKETLSLGFQDAWGVSVQIPLIAEGWYGQRYPVTPDPDGTGRYFCSWRGVILAPGLDIYRAFQLFNEPRPLLELLAGWLDHKLSGLHVRACRYRVGMRDLKNDEDFAFTHWPVTVDGFLFTKGGFRANLSPEVIGFGVRAKMQAKWKCQR